MESREKANFVETLVRTVCELNDSVGFDSCLASRHNAAQIPFGTFGLSMSVGICLGSLEIAAFMLPIFWGPI